MTFQERLYTTASGAIVKEGDPSAAFLLGGVGQEVPVRWREKVAAFHASQRTKPIEVTAETTVIIEPTNRDPLVENRDSGAPRRRGRPPKS